MNNITKNNGRPPKAGFHLDKSNAKLFGVCSGLENATGIDAIWWRIGFVATTLMGFGLPILIYGAVALISD
ncbi:PspC domain-containing protein [Erythrobacter sp. THAF29]|uniref:PspC domain-containing protein n=1 Tax=Erythrobacter sp. THAF29 TaxID=2587851 RepID=UPI001268FEC6|nr:PspC domain-containing protein [Erythrobacter sp. THAF29]QFT78427.1 PspC domain protein [Erythrobacter sp. THAF29]